MTIIQGSMHGKNATALLRALNNRQSVNTSGSLKARAIAQGEARQFGSGRLEGADLDFWRADWDRITYVVLSYSTPIAWVVDDGSDRGHFYRVGQSFSMTTAHHQGKLYAVDLPAGYFA